MSSSMREWVQAGFITYAGAAGWRLDKRTASDEPGSLTRRGPPPWGWETPGGGISPILHRPWPNRSRAATMAPQWFFAGPQVQWQAQLKKPSSTTI